MPDTERLKDHCRSLAATTEDVKWVDNLCFCVGGKIFAMFDLDEASEFSFKCDEEDYDRLTETPGVIPAPYAARFGWVKVTTSAKLPAKELRALLTKAHRLVALKLTAKKRRELGLS